MRSIRDPKLPHTTPESGLRMREALGRWELERNKKREEAHEKQAETQA